jgi:hypothetical protein
LRDVVDVHFDVKIHGGEFATRRDGCDQGCD